MACRKSESLHGLYTEAYIVHEPSLSLTQRLPRGILDLPVKRSESTQRGEAKPNSEIATRAVLQRFSHPHVYVRHVWSATRLENVDPLIHMKADQYRYTHIQEDTHLHPLAFLLVCRYVSFQYLTLSSLYLYICVHRY